MNANVDRVESQIAILAGVLAILMAESLLMQQEFLLGILLYSVILLSIVLYGAYEWEHPQHQLLVLTIPSIIRLLDFTLPLNSFSPLFAQLIVAIPLALAGSVFVWLLKQGAFIWQFNWRHIPYYLLMVVLGTGAGILLFQFKQPLRLLWDSPLLFSFYVFVLLVAMAFLEEWLFRGIMQTALTGLMGKGLAGLVVALVYTILHVNQSTWMFVLLIFFFALGLSWIRSRSENLLNVCLVHGVANILFFLILPLYR